MGNKYVVLTDSSRHDPVCRTQAVWHFDTYEDADRFIRSMKLPTQWRIYAATTYNTSGE
jgi:hypothetical protein